MSETRNPRDPRQVRPRPLPVEVSFKHFDGILNTVLMATETLKASMQPLGEGFISFQGILAQFIREFKDRKMLNDQQAKKIRELEKEIKRLKKELKKAKK